MILIGDNVKVVHTDKTDMQFGVEQGKVFPVVDIDSDGVEPLLQIQVSKNVRAWVWEQQVKLVR